MRHLAVAALASLLLSGPAAAATVGADLDAPAAPVLTVQDRGTLSELWVRTVLPDGSSPRKRLRLSPATVRPGPTGTDPAGRAAFATWTENGEPWSAFSRDAGVTWSEARPLREELMLLDGPVTSRAAMPAAPLGLSLPADGRLFLVQLRTVSLPEWRSALTEAGARVLAYFPHNAHILEIPPAALARVAALDFVRRVEPYHTGYRLEPELREWLAGTGPAADEASLRLRVMAFEWGPAGKQRIRAAAEALGAVVAEHGPEGHVIELWLDREQLRALAGHDDVMWIDRWTPRETDMNLVRQDAGTDWLEADSGSCGQGVRGEVLDSGIQDDHPDFDGVIFHNAYNQSSHGTHTYGIVFGNGARDGDGQAQATGHMPCAEQGIFADYGSLGNRFNHTQELKNSPYFASFQTNSWGNSRTTSYTSISSEMDDIIWRLDIAITQSQSNAGNQNSRPQAWAKNIIAVGGIRHYNTATTADDAWAGGASIGPAADGRIKPDLNYWYDSVYSPTTNSSYSNFGGTSAATPEVAGVLGLMVQMWSENVWNTNPSGTTVFERQPHAGTIKALLVNNAQQYPFSGTTHDLTRTHQGWGRPNVQLAKERAATSFIVDQDQPLQVGESLLYFVDVQGGESELKVTMVYPDPPGTTSSSLHRINDLDLTLISPSAVTYHGNVGLDAATESTPGGGPNGVDTVENVFVTNPEPGTWTVEVSAPEINQDAHLETSEDDAVFALVVTGAAASTGLSTPGEASGSGQPLLIAGYDKGTGLMSLTYDPACSAVDHVIEYGELTPANIASYNWTGQECALGTTGSHVWDTSSAPDSVFFVIVGQTIDVEGSYGEDSGGGERDEDASGSGCPLPQNLSNPCS